MGQSTDGQICYGVYVGDELPWSDGEDFEYDGDEDEWWRKRSGYEPPFEMFTEDGEWIGGEEWPREKVDAYFDHRREWDKAHPKPFELVNACSGDCPEWIVAMPGTFKSVSRGYPEKISEGTISLVHKEAALERYKAFLAEIGIEGEPSWYLSSYWG